MQGSLLVHDLRKVITLVDLLRDVGLDKQLSLPKVVVLGNQSSGKSSLLEQIVGLDFLPRGSGVVTRRPLELRMNNVPDLKCPYAEFDEVVEGGKKKKFLDFNLVRKTIQEVTDKICGKSKDIIDNPIVLNIFSGTCPNLTIVDLPGITSIPVGNQPGNIYQITKKMALRYVREKRSIILCVIPANQDLSTSQALKILGEVDPSGQRSIGCLTKIDIMDRGVDAKKVLKNQQIPLRYGYVGIKNRSQEDINNNIPVSESLKTERKYFTTSPIYSTLPPETFGTQSLTHKLTSILYTQIKSSMPQIFMQLTKKKKQAELQLQGLGTGVASNDAELVNYAWKSIADFLRILKNSMNGIKSIEYNKDPVSGQIRRQLSQLYLQEYQIPATEAITDKEIDRAITNFPGDSIPGFPSIDAFLALLNPLLRKLEQPAFTLTHKIHQIIENQCQKIVDSAMVQKFPDFNRQFILLVKGVLDKYRKQLDRYLKMLLDSELNQLYTNDATYLQGEFGLTERDRKKMEKSAIKDPLQFELRKRIDSYYKLCVRNLRDLVPKQVFNFLGVKCINQLQFEAYQFTTDVQKLKQYLNQPEQIRKKRQSCQKALQIFQESEKKIRMDPQISKLIKDSTKQNKYYAKHGMKSPQQQRKQRENQLNQNHKKQKEKQKQNILPQPKLAPQIVSKPIQTFVDQTVPPLTNIQNNPYNKNNNIELISKNKVEITKNNVPKVQISELFGMGMDLKPQNFAEKHPDQNGNKSSRNNNNNNNNSNNNNNTNFDDLFNFQPSNPTQLINLSLKKDVRENNPNQKTQSEKKKASFSNLFGPMNK